MSLRWIRLRTKQFDVQVSRPSLSIRSLSSLCLSSATACREKALNGVCDQECNRIGCDYDREDCLPTQNEGLLGTIILQLEIDRDTFDKRKEAFLQRFSRMAKISDRFHLDDLLHSTRFHLE